MNQQQFAKALRQNMTDAEQLLWRHLRAHRLLGQKFRRQQAIGPYIVDFVHFGARLIIEADGDSTMVALVMPAAMPGSPARVSRCCALEQRYCAEQ